MMTGNLLSGMSGGMEALAMPVTASARRALLSHVALLLQENDNVLKWVWRNTEWMRDYINFGWKLGNFQFSIGSVAFGIIIFFIALFISRYLRAFLESRMAAHKHLDPGVQYTILRLVNYVVTAIGVLYALKVAIGADLTSIAVLFTALSVGIGFGLQFIAGDIASGFILLFERPVRVGDFITVTGPDSKLTEGRVQSINLRTTVVMTNDHIVAIVPNSKLVNQNLINWSYADRRARISIPIGVAYNSDVELVTRTLLRAAEGVEHVMAEPKPSVQFLEFADFSLNFRLLVWTERPRRHPKIRSDINYRIRQLFLEAGIEIPFPQQDLNLRGGSLRLDARSQQLLAAEDAAPEDEREPNLSRR